MAEKLFENWILKLVSLAFAVVLWFFVMGERRLEVAYIIPMEYKGVPQGLMVANEVPNSVAVRISGPRTLLMNLSQSDISIGVDLKDLPPGVTSFKRLEENLNIPSGLKVTRISPSYVDIKLERIRDKEVPVKVMLSGTPDDGMIVAGTTVTPQKVAVTGAESELKGVSEILTEGVDLTGVKESFSQTVALSYIGNYTDLKDVKTVEVQVMLEPDPNYQPPEPEVKSSVPKEQKSKEQTGVEPQ